VVVVEIGGFTVIAGVAELTDTDVVPPARSGTFTVAALGLVTAPVF
jgi:hypothetical protein